MNYKILDLTVKNHPGVMSHITGLFSRRTFNLEGIVCFPLEDNEKSRMLLMINEDQQIHQVISQLDKLYDVIDISVNDSVEKNPFAHMDSIASGLIKQK